MKTLEEIALHERAAAPPLSTLATWAGIPYNDLIIMRTQAAYKQVLMHGTTPPAIIESTESVAGALNGQIQATLLELFKIRDTAEKEDVRLKACLAILDRAPNMPKVKEAETAPTIHIHIPMVQRKNIEAALEEIGEGEIIKLLEATDGSGK